MIRKVLKLGKVFIVISLATTFVLVFHSIVTGYEKLLVSLTSSSNTNEERKVELSRPFPEMTMQERLSTVKKRCHELQNTGDIVFDSHNNVTGFIDHKHKIFACSNLKAASSTLVDIISKVNNVSRRTWRKYRKDYLQKTLPINIINSYDYLKIMLVRDPMTKVTSMYSEQWGPPKENGSKISYPQFMADIGNKVSYTMDRHYSSSMDRCLPCDISYTYIGTTETIDSDLAPVLQYLGLDLQSVPRINSHYTEAHRKRLFGSVSTETKRNIWERYRKDYFVFGYKPPM